MILLFQLVRLTQSPARTVMLCVCAGLKEVDSSKSQPVLDVSWLKDY